MFFQSKVIFYVFCGCPSYDYYDCSDNDSFNKSQGNEQRPLPWEIWYSKFHLHRNNGPASGVNQKPSSSYKDNAHEAPYHWRQLYRHAGCPLTFIAEIVNLNEACNIEGVVYIKAIYYFGKQQIPDRRFPWLNLTSLGHNGLLYSLQRSPIVSRSVKFRVWLTSQLHAERETASEIPTSRRRIDLSA